MGISGKNALESRASAREPVKNIEQLDCLRSLHCDQYQGFLSGQPLLAVAMEALLKIDAQISPAFAPSRAMI